MRNQDGIVSRTTIAIAGAQRGDMLDLAPRARKTVTVRVAFTTDLPVANLPHAPHEGRPPRAKHSSARPQTPEVSGSRRRWWHNRTGCSANHI